MRFPRFLRRRPSGVKSLGIIGQDEIGTESYQFAAPDPWAPDAYDLIRAQVGEAGVPAPMADDLAQQMLSALRAHHDEENT